MDAAVYVEVIINPIWLDSVLWGLNNTYNKQLGKIMFSIWGERPIFGIGVMYRFAPRLRQDGTAKRSKKHWLQICFLTITTAPRAH